MAFLAKIGWLKKTVGRLRTASVTRILPLLLLLTLPAVVQAQFTFTTNNGVLTITGYTGPGGAAVIPSSTNGYPVTSLAEQAFYSTTDLTSVTIPNSVTNIGNNALPYTTSFTNITVAPSNPVFSSAAGVLFDKYQTTLLQYPAGRAGTQYAVPNTVTSIGFWAFTWCASLTNVTIPNSVTSIGSTAFSQCTHLRAMQFPSSVTTSGARRSGNARA
jgi:hypothetical protein